MKGKVTIRNLRVDVPDLKEKTTDIHDALIKVVENQDNILGALRDLKVKRYSDKTPWHRIKDLFKKED